MTLQNNLNDRPTVIEQDLRRENILTSLLEMELRDVANDYLSRTRQSYPIHYVFRLPDTQF